MSHDRDELKQRRPFQPLEEEVFVAVQRTADVLMQRLETLLKSAGLSATQYNVLRILRGAVEEGRSCGDIAERMITRDPDITRLLDRMEARGLVSRCREHRDRRVVLTRISPEGLSVLEKLDEPMAELMRGLLGHLGRQKLHDLLELLDGARSNAQS